MTQNKRTSSPLHAFGFTGLDVVFLGLLILAVIIWLVAVASKSGSNDDAQIISTPDETVAGLSGTPILDTPTLPAQTTSVTSPTLTSAATSTVPPAPTPLSTETAIPTSMPTEIATPTSPAAPPATPTPEINGVINVNILNLRIEPNTNLAFVGTLVQNTEVIILGKNQAESWLRVQSQENEGWVIANSVSLTNVDNLANVPELIGEINNFESSATDTIAPHTFKSYRFTPESDRPTLQLLLRSEEPFNFDQVAFVVSSGGTRVGEVTSTEQPSGSNSLNAFLWRDIISRERYVVDIFNLGSNPVEFCLSLGEVTEWICN